MKKIENFYKIILVVLFIGLIVLNSGCSNGRMCGSMSYYKADRNRGLAH